MATFSYEAVDALGKQHKGTLEAVDVSQANALLKQDGKIPISVSSANAMSKDIKITAFDKKPTSRNLAVFCRQFVSITSAGVPVTQALEMLGEQTENKLLSEAIVDTRTAIQGGSTFSEAMGNHPKVFPSLLITMTAAGEESGNLETSFSRMGEQFEKDAKLKAMMKKASIYPITVIIVAIAVVILMLTFVVPQFATMLTDMGSELPWITVMVMGASEFMQSYWYIVLAVIVGATVLFKQWAKTELGEITIGRLQLKLPLFGPLAVKTASSRMSRTMSTLVAAGIPIIDAIEIVSRTMDNALFRDALLEAKDDVAMGTPYSEPLMRSGLFPPLVCHMTKIGEEVGDIEGMLNKLADYYDEEVEMAVASLMAAMEPLIIIILALVIGVIVGAVMAPMAEMYSSLDNL